MTTQTNMAFCGWDIGGAHLKVAYADATGNLLHVFQLPCALWKGIDALNESIRLLGWGGIGIDRKTNKDGSEE